MKAYIQTLNILDSNELNLIDDYITKKNVEKDSVLLRNNSICEELYFVRSGALRSFHINNDGVEVTSCIAFDGEFMCDFSSFILQQSSQEAIHSLLESEIEIIKYNDLESLYDTSISWQKVGRKIIEKQYIQMEQHFAKYQQNNSLGRYEYIYKNYPRRLALIPQHYIASYLGISTRQLTRIRKTFL